MIGQQLLRQLRAKEAAEDREQDDVAARERCRHLGPRQVAPARAIRPDSSKRTGGLLEHPLDEELVIGGIGAVVVIGRHRFDVIGVGSGGSARPAQSEMDRSRADRADQRAQRQPMGIVSRAAVRLCSFQKRAAQLLELANESSEP